MKKHPNVTNEIMKANLIRGYKAKYVFDTEEEAKVYFDRLKAEMGELPTYLKQNLK